jgi:hypothetical protein
MVGGRLTLQSRTAVLMVRTEGIDGRRRRTSACIAGALTDSDYERLLKSAGFQDVQIEHVSDSNIGEYPFSYFSSHIKAKKPAAGSLKAP